MKNFYGMMAPMPTIFNEDESINLEGCLEIVEFLIKNGIHIITVCGSTGEYSLMSIEERKFMIKEICKAVNGRVKVIAGCSSNRTSDTIELVRFAEEAGADMVLVLPPYYTQTTRQGIIDYYTEVANASSLGVVIYHYPIGTNVVLEPDLILELSKIKGVVGVKNTHDMIHTSMIMGLTRDEDFEVINGNDHLALSSLSEGCKGSMGIVHDLLPKHMVEILEAVEKNDIKKASELNDDLRELYTLLISEPNPGPLKAGLELLGLPGGNPRRPLVPASQELRDKIEVELRKLNLIK